MFLNDSENAHALPLLSVLSQPYSMRVMQHYRHNDVHQIKVQVKIAFLPNNHLPCIKIQNSIIGGGKGVTKSVEEWVCG